MKYEWVVDGFLPLEKTYSRQAVAFLPPSTPPILCSEVYAYASETSTQLTYKPCPVTVKQSLTPVELLL